MSATNGSLLTDEQIPLASTYKAVHASNGKRLRELAVRALVANGVSQGTIARETEREPSAITRMLSGEQGITPDVLAAILAHDTLGTFVMGLAGMVGYEAKRLTPDPGERIKKLEGALAAAISALQEATR
jgi:plasmid maintenance system antidote protein VapI